MQHTRIPSLLLAILTSACVYAPESGGEFDPSEPLVFRGLASQPGATIRLLGYDQRTGEWVELAMTVADATPNEFRDSRVLYNWQLALTLDAREDWRCFLASSCDVEDQQDLEAHFVVREVDGVVPNLFTYDVGGFECWWNNYTAGEDLLSAYWPCRAESADQIRLSATLP